MIRDRVEALESRMREFRSKRGPTDEDEVESIEREASGISAELAEMGHDLDEVSLAVKDLRRSLRWAVIRDLTALLSWGATAFALVFSLNSLAAGRDTVSIGVSESLVTVPMSLLIVQGVSTLFELPNLKSFQNVSTRSSDSTNGRVDDS
jgi:hypothetical protein